jgi:hypothetical protein
VFYPGAAVSQNSICTLLQKIGQDGGKRKRFYLRRMEAVAADHHIAIDGTLIQDTSKVNDLSAFSYKARTKGRKEISVLYAYDIELMEDLNQAWRMTGYNEPPRSDDGRWIHTMKYELEDLEKLGLSIPAPKPEPKKRGRPRKNPETAAPKRPRGRPGKNPVPDEQL